jgi:predicted alpha/beta-hydrolase family hydrolase
VTRPEALLLTPGAGSGREHHTLMALEAAVVPLPTARIDFPYRREGRKAPDRPAKLVACVRDEATSLADAAGLDPEAVVLGGRSMGGRAASMLAARDFAADGLLLLAYPLHPAGKPDNLRVEHFPRLGVPVLFVSGDRDALAGKADLEKWAGTIPGPVDFHWLAGGDHGFRVPKSLGGEGEAATLAEVADVSVSWVADLPGSP